MKRNFVRAGALFGAATLPLLIAGPTMAANAPISQAWAQSLDVTIGGKPAISQKIAATNDGTTQTKSSNDTLPQLSQLIPGNTQAGLGVAPQDAFAFSDGTSSACAGLAGQGGGVVQTGNSPCSMSQGTPVTLGFANITLGTLLAANNNAALVPLTNALQQLYGPLNQAAVQPILDALKSIPISANIVLDGIGAHCQAEPGTASGGAGVAHLTVPLTIGGQTINVINLQADGRPNQKLIGDLSGATTMLTSAISKAVLGAVTITGGGSATPTTPLSGLTVPLANLVGTVQTGLLDPIINAIQTPLLNPLSQNVLEATFNKQPVPQAPGTFDATALDLQVLPAAQQAIGASLITGDIGHVNCGPNTKAGNVSPSPSAPASPAGPAAKLPKAVNSGQGAGENLLLGGTAALLSMSGGLGLLAYRRYWMPRG